jgi:chromosome segregation ATPase
MVIVKNNYQSLEQDGEILGRAADLVQVPGDLRPSIELLLGTTYLVRDRSSARRIIEKLRKIDPACGHDLCIATLDGQVFYPGGPVHVRGLKNSEGTQDILSRQRRNRELVTAIEETQRQIEIITGRLEILEQDYIQAGKTKDRLTSQLQIRRSEQQQAALAADKAGLAVEQTQRQLDWHQARQESLLSELSLRETRRKQLIEEHASSKEEIKDLQNLCNKMPVFPTNH